jgi:hypothetical protein
MLGGRTRSGRGPRRTPRCKKDAAVYLLMSIPIVRSSLSFRSLLRTRGYCG